MHKKDVILRIIQSFCWELLHAAFSCMQYFIWLLSGTYWRLQESYNPENYHRSAQVLNVIGRLKFEEYFPLTKLTSFLLMHDCFDSPERVLQDHISLFRITRHEAWFVEARPGSELWRARYSPFYYMAQFRHAVRIVRMPVSSFHRLADQLRDPENLILLNCSARCGSSLLTQMFEHTDQVVSFAEPLFTNDLGNMLSEKKGHDADVDRMIVSTVRIMCKPTALRERAYVFKVIPFDMRHLPAYLALFPQAHCLFLYRDGLKMAQSMYRVLQQQKIPKAAEILRFSPRVHRWITGYMDISTLSDKCSSVTVSNMLTLSVAIWASAIDDYLQFRAAGLPIAGVRYEDIIKDPDCSMRRVLRHCGLPADQLAAAACKALATDSQRDTPLQSSTLRQLATVEYSGAERDEVDAVCDAFQLPRFSQGPYIALGTITNDAPD